MTIRVTRASAAGANAASAHPTARTIATARRGIADTSASLSAEELRGELVQILLPVDPGVTAGRFLVLRLELVLGEQGDRVLRTPEQEVLLPGGEPEHPQPALRRHGGRHLLLVLLLPLAHVLGEDGGAEHPDGAVVRRLGQEQGERLPA